MTALSDKVLVGRVQRIKCQSSFNTLVLRHQSQLRYSLRQMTGWNESLADDLAQETFIKAYLSIATYKGTAKFSSWLYRIAYNLMTSHFRLKKNKEVSGLENREISMRSVDSASHSIDLHRDLARAMSVLPIKQRMALHLSLHRDLTQNEISIIMELPLGTVKTVINRGKLALRESLDDWNIEERK